MCVYACIDFNGNSSHRFTDVHLHVLAHANVHIFLLSKVRNHCQDDEHGSGKIACSHCGAGTLRAEKRRFRRKIEAFIQR